MLGGCGFGIYIAADLAIATQVLPSAHNRAKDLALISTANVLPQLFLPAISGVIVATHGYSILFACLTVLAVLAGLCILPVKAAR